jgi:DNA repair photolyase
MAIKGRGTADNPANRYAPRLSVREIEADPPPPTEVRAEQARQIISYNESPDIPFDRSINPYRGCEHGCIYCFARPTHAYLDLSPGLDFETKLSAKVNAAACLRAELAKPGYRCRPITLGANTDPYQPIEQRYRLTRQLLEVLWEHRHPCVIITKSQRILSDLPLLAQLAEQRLVQVMVSVTTLDDELKRRLEPRAASGRARLDAIAQLSAAGVPVGVLAAPMIPALNDAELETILTAARDAGARSAGYVLLRLPLEVAPLFEQWLAEHYPGRAAHVLSLIRQSRGGRNYDAQFHHRMRGQGVFADLLAQRFRHRCRQLGLNGREQVTRTDLFRVPGAQCQLALFAE